VTRAITVCLSDKPIQHRTPPASGGGGEDPSAALASRVAHEVFGPLPHQRGYTDTAMTPDRSACTRADVKAGLRLDSAPRPPHRHKQALARMCSFIGTAVPRGRRTTSASAWLGRPPSHSALASRRLELPLATNGESRALAGLFFVVFVNCPLGDACWVQAVLDYENGFEVPMAVPWASSAWTSYMG
jgi:hypothetical protein